MNDDGPADMQPSDTPDMRNARRAQMVQAIDKTDRGTASVQKMMMKQGRGH